MGNIDDGVGKANGGARTIKGWTNKTIILNSLMAYMSKLKKQSKQPGSNFFPSCSTNVIWNVTFASRCL